MPRKRTPKDRVEQPKGDSAEIPSQCPADSASLDYRGFCELGRGYPESMRCPFVCPLCRKRLTWSGACFFCFGANSASRHDWTMPGDRYELRERHWVFVSGPGQVVSIEDGMALSANIDDIVSRRISAEQGALRAQVILAKYTDNPVPAAGGVPF